MMTTTVGELPEPMEYLDLEHANSVVLNINRAELGTAQIHPKNLTPRNIRLYMQQNGLSEPPAAGVPVTVRIPVLRLFGSRVDATSPLSYWDVSSKTLQANLWPRLQAFNGLSLQLTITANGVRPTKRYSVEQG
jgi:hypothetical protein